MWHWILLAVYNYTHSYIFSLELALHHLQESFSPGHSAEQLQQEEFAPGLLRAWVLHHPLCLGDPSWGLLIPTAEVRTYFGFSDVFTKSGLLQVMSAGCHFCFNGHGAAPCVGLAELVRPDVCQTAACWKWDISTPATNHVEKCPVLDTNTTWV